MGVTDWKLLTVAGETNWRRACEAEEEARFHWVSKWGWITGEIKKTNEQLTSLLSCRREILQASNRGSRQSSIEKHRHIFALSDPLPFPETTAREIGWLASKPDWLLDVFGPQMGSRERKGSYSFTEEQIQAARALIRAERISTLRSKISKRIE